MRLIVRSAEETMSFVYFSSETQTGNCLITQLRMLDTDS